MKSQSKGYSLAPFDEQTFFECLSNVRCSPATIKRKRIALYLFEYLRALDARQLVIEHEYTDGDYLDDYASFYSRCFAEYSRKCKRLHFFSAAMTDETFDALVLGDRDAELERKIQESYLGFCIVRPLPETVIGRTVLKTYGSDRGRRHYTCTRAYEASLFGIPFKLESLAFQEQDSAVAACATVALWSCFHKAAPMFGTRIPTPAAITTSANRFLHQNRAVPSHGLIVEQICSAVRDAGLEPEVFEVKPNTPLASLMYSYLSMGLPVILGVHVEGVGQHAITITGFSLREDLVLKHEVAPREQSVQLTGLHIDEFYAHDDQIGPFARIKLRPATTDSSESYPVTFEGSWIEPVTNKELKLLPRVVIVPIYHKVRITFLDMLEWLTRADQVFGLLVEEQTRCEWDLRLIDVNHFKRSLREDRPLTAAKRRQVLTSHHPRFIWSGGFRVDGRLVLQFLGDATDTARSLPIYEVLWHESTFRDRMSAILGTPALFDRVARQLTAGFAEKLRSSCADADAAPESTTVAPQA